MKGVHVIRVPFGRIFTAVYLLEGRELGLVDSGFQASPDEVVLPYVRRIGRSPQEITLVVITHWHGDHVDGARTLKRLYGTRVAIHELGVRGVEEPGVETVETYGELLTREERETALQEKPKAPVKVDLALKDGDKVQLGDRSLRVLHTPGHVRDAISLLDEGERLLLTGDSVQAWGPNPDGGPFYNDLQAYRASLKRLTELNPKAIYAAHPYRPFKDCVFDGEDAGAFLRESQEATDRIHELVHRTLEAAREPLDLTSIADAAAKAFEFESNQFTTKTTILAHLKELATEGRAESAKAEGRTLWRPRS